MMSIFLANFSQSFYREQKLTHIYGWALFAALCIVIRWAFAVSERRNDLRVTQGRDRRNWLEYSALAERSMQEWTRQRG